MSESQAQQADLVASVTRSAQGLDPAAQLAVVTAAITPPEAKTANTLWIILVSGLVGLLVISLGGLIYLIADGVDGSDVVLTVFSSVLTGLIGLFSPTPSKAGK